MIWFQKVAVVSVALFVTCACSRQPTPEELTRNVEAAFQEISIQLRHYASAHKRFPATLRELPEKAVDVVDWQSVNTKCRRNYGYVVSPDGLIAVLVSVGPDGQAHTPDDHVKVIGIESSENVNGKEIANALLRTVYATWSCVPMGEKRGKGPG
jgi:hypothetical protein